MEFTVEEIREQALNNPDFKKDLIASLKNGSKRGRPALPDHLKKVKVTAEGGKRGRPGLSDEEKAKRDAEKADKPKGKRGRPAKVETPEALQALIANATAKLNQVQVNA